MSKFPTIAPQVGRALSKVRKAHRLSVHTPLDRPGHAMVLVRDDGTDRAVNAVTDRLTRLGYVIASVRRSSSLYGEAQILVAPKPSSVMPRTHSSTR